MKSPKVSLPMALGIHMAQKKRIKDVMEEHKPDHVMDIHHEDEHEEEAHQSVADKILSHRRADPMAKGGEVEEMQHEDGNTFAYLTDEDDLHPMDHRRMMAEGGLVDEEHRHDREADEEMGEDHKDRFSGEHEEHYMEGLMDEEHKHDREADEEPGMDHKSRFAHGGMVDEDEHKMSMVDKIRMRRKMYK